MSALATVVLRTGQLLRLVRQQGPVAALRAVWRRLRHGPKAVHFVDVLGHFAYIDQAPLAPRAGQAQPKSVQWFVPDFNVGSGGHLNIFRLVWHLEQMGYVCRIAIVRPTVHHDAELAREAIRTHFFPLNAEVRLGCHDLEPSTFAVATSWDTAYTVRAFTGAQHKVYFVQDYEPFFYAHGSEYVLAQNTYDFGFFGITAGGWLARRLARKHGMRTHAVGFGVELDRYRRLPRRQPEVRHVFFYARPPTPRRAFELGLMVLNRVWQRMPEVRFVLAGWDTQGYDIPFPHLSCGTVALDDLPDLYSQCDVALVLSLTNLSLLPLELMACGCAVVSNKGDNVQWLLNDEVAVLAEPTPEALGKAVCALLADDAGRRALTARAEAMARAQTWDAVAREFEIGLQQAGESS